MCGGGDAPNKRTMDVLVSLGTYQIPIEQLHEPPPCLQVREVKQWYVDYLVKMLQNDLDDHEDLTAPLLVVTSVKKKQFSTANIDKYTYQVFFIIVVIRMLKSDQPVVHGYHA